MSTWAHRGCEGGSTTDSAQILVTTDRRVRGGLLLAEAENGVGGHKPDSSATVDVQVGCPRISQESSKSLTDLRTLTSGDTE
jgi:hypothetical protein